MKINSILLFMLLASSHCMFGQVTQDSLTAHHIYAPNHFNDSISAEESWEIHKAAYIKQLKSKGLTDAEIKKSMVTYEKEKEEFIAQVKEQHRLAAIQREKAAELRASAEIIRAKADKQRKLAAIQREKADELRKLADIQRGNADAQRGKSGALIEKANELRKKAEELRKLADIQRIKAEELRKKAQEWRKNTKTILTKNVTLTKQSNNSSPTLFNVTSKATLHIGIRAHISAGTTLVELYTPSGTKEGELSLKFNSKLASNKKGEEIVYTSGTLDKTIPGAEAGEWQIKISSQNSEGTVAMSVAEYTKPTVNE